MPAGTKVRLRRLLCRSRSCIPLLLAVYATAAANGAELVTLRNGFTLTCAEHQQITPQTLRLYMNGTAPAAERNYVDVALSSILSIGNDPAATQTDNASARPHGGMATPPAAPALATLLQHSGAAHNVNAALLASVVRAESAGNAHAVSRTGARGLMQLMPNTAAELGVHDSFAPAENVDGGSLYLDRLLTRYHDDVALTLAAYNAGPAAVDRYHGIPPFRETRLYVARVLREFNRLALAERSPASIAAAVPGTSR